MHPYQWTVQQWRKLWRQYASELVYKSTLFTCRIYLCISVNGCHWNRCKLVFTGIHIQVPILVLTSIWMQPKSGTSYTRRIIIILHQLGRHNSASSYTCRMYCFSLAGRGRLSTSWRMSQLSWRRTVRRHSRCRDFGSQVSCRSHSALAGSEATATARSEDISATSSAMQTAPTSARSGSMSSWPWRRARLSSE